MIINSLAFTGTREGMTQPQLSFIAKIVTVVYIPDEVHHGDCIGADEQFHIICRQATDALIHIWPPLNPKYRAYCIGDNLHGPMGYLERDRAIVDSSVLLLAAPINNTRSGTWYTINYAESKHKPIIIVFPDGAVEKRRV